MGSGLHLGLVCGRDLGFNWPSYILMSGMSTYHPYRKDCEENYNFFCLKESFHFKEVATAQWEWNWNDHFSRRKHGIHLKPLKTCLHGEFTSQRRRNFKVLEINGYSFCSKFGVRWHPVVDWGYSTRLHSSLEGLLVCLCWVAVVVECMLFFVKKQQQNEEHVENKDFHLYQSTATLGCTRFAELFANSWAPW